MHVGAGRIGQINAGATADLAFFDIPVDIATPAGIETTIDNLIRHGAGTNRATVISGRLLYNAGAFDIADASGDVADGDPTAPVNPIPTTTPAR